MSGKSQGILREKIGPACGKPVFADQYLDWCSSYVLARPCVVPSFIGQGLTEAQTNYKDTTHAY